MNTKAKNPTAPDDADSAAGTTSGSTSSVAPDAPTEVNVAYHDGPPTLGFYGSRWERGKAKTVSAADWAAMQARADCAPFDFRVV